MFYKNVVDAWKTGKVRIGLPALGFGNTVSIEATGLVGLQAKFLSRAERLELAELAKLDAMAKAKAETAS